MAAVIDEVVKRDICIGCGLCAGVCPQNNLTMHFNSIGELNPVPSTNRCPPDCRYCLTVCPFYDTNPNEDELAAEVFQEHPPMQRTSETGYYRSIYAGFVTDNNLRERSASGGLATWFLGKLLDEKIVDKVACVTPVTGEERLFRYEMLDSSAKIAASGCRSAYYPVDLAAVIREIKSTNARYAIIALPCAVKALRLAMRKDAVLAKRIPIIAGLTCGQTRGRFFAEYLCGICGGDYRELHSARWRIKDPKHPANDYSYSCEWGHPTKTASVHWRQGMGSAWARGFFRPNPCNFCDDVFAELADVVFMDAWLERYINDPWGTNIAISRRPLCDMLLSAGAIEGELKLESIPVSEAVKSQRGVLNMKRSCLAQRLGLLELFRARHIFRKRVKPSKPPILTAVILWFELVVIANSKREFAKKHASGFAPRFGPRTTILLFVQKTVNYLEVILWKLHIIRRADTEGA